MLEIAADLEGVEEPVAEAEEEAQDESEEEEEVEEDDEPATKKQKIVKALTELVDLLIE